MKKAIITGTGGLVGSHLVRQLNATYETISISRRPSEVALKHLNLDLSAPWDSALLPDKCDYIVHLAQSEHFRDFPQRAEEIFSVNTISTLRLLEYGRRAGIKTFILASSGGVYGTGDSALTEDSPVLARGDLGFYLGTKLCSEIIAENYSKYMNVVILRFFFVYGPGQKSHMLIPRLIRSVVTNRPIKLQGEEGIRINPTHVSDAVTAIQRAMDLGRSDRINVGGPEILSLKAVAEIIGKKTDKKPAFDIDHSSKPLNVIGSIEKLSHLLAPPRVRFEDGIDELIRFDPGAFS